MPGFFVKGMPVEEYIGYPRTMFFELVDNQIIIIMNRENIERYPLGGRFEFRFEPVYNTIPDTQVTWMIASQ